MAHPLIALEQSVESSSPQSGRDPGGGAGSGPSIVPPIRTPDDFTDDTADSEAPDELDEEAEDDEDDLDDDEADDEEENEAVLDEAPEPTEPTMSKQKQQEKSLLTEMRSLLRDYPMKLDLRQIETIRDVVHNLLLIYDLLRFVTYKTNKEDIKALAQAEIEAFDAKVDILTLRRRYLKQHRNSHYANSSGSTRIETLIKYNMDYIADRVQFYALAVPSKDKPYMHLRTAQGLAASQAEEYESSEIQEGEKVGPDTSFKIDDEGRVIVLN